VGYNFQIECNKIELLKEYKSVTQNVLLLIELNIVYGIPNCKEARLDDFCELQERASWIRSKSSCEVLGLPSP
jgi:hypothetical protein